MEYQYFVRGYGYGSPMPLLQEERFIDLHSARKCFDRMKEDVGIFFLSISRDSFIPCQATEGQVDR